MNLVLQPTYPVFVTTEETCMLCDNLNLYFYVLKNSHLILTRNQQLPVDTHDHYHRVEVLSSQVLIAPLLQCSCDLKYMNVYQQKKRIHE